MTAINTNTAALNAQFYLAKTNKEMEGTMAKLSSGQKVVRIKMLFLTTPPIKRPAAE